MDLKIAELLAAQKRKELGIEEAYDRNAYLIAHVLLHPDCTCAILGIDHDKVIEGVGRLIGEDDNATEH